MASPAPAVQPPPPATDDPLPLPPTLTSPGPRATALSTAFHRALDTTLQKCDYANFAACFPTPAQYAPSALREFHREFVGRLGEVARGEFEGVLREREVVAGLNGLDEVIGEARGRREGAGEEGAVPDAPHTLPPSRLHTAHLQPFLNTQHTALTAALAGLQEENVGLAEEITKQRAEIEALTAALENVVRDIEGAGNLLNGSEAEGYAGEVKEVEMELGN